MQYDINSSDGTAIVSLKGDLTFADHPTMKAMLAELSSSGQQRWTFDLSALSAIDSAGIGMMLIAKDESGKANATLELNAPSGAVRTVLELTKIDEMIGIN